MTTYLLLETGDFLLQENGDKLILVFVPDSIYEIKFASGNPILQLQDNDFIIKSFNTPPILNSTKNNFTIKDSDSNIIIREAQ